MEVTKSNRRFVPDFLSLSVKKNRAQSVVSTGSTVSLTRVTEDGATTEVHFIRALGMIDDATTHSASATLNSPRSLGFSRAASYLMRRSLAPKSRVVGVELEKEFSGCVREEGRVDDLFSSELNRCSTAALPQLRLERAELYPIVCYESDDEDTHNQAGDVVLEARIEALNIQEKLLGKDHSDVIFLSRHVQRLRGHSELLRSSLEHGGTTSRAHYVPKSAFMNVPIDYPFQ
jgi:hypothetical protein